MGNYTLVLSEGEVACGVTEEQVAEVLPKGAFFSGGDVFALPAGTPPALAGAAARVAFGGPAEFSHLNSLTKYPMYRRATSKES